MQLDCSLLGRVVCQSTREAPFHTYCTYIRTVHRYSTYILPEHTYVQRTYIQYIHTYIAYIPTVREHSIVHPCMHTVREFFGEVIKTTTSRVELGKYESISSR